MCLPISRWLEPSPQVELPERSSRLAKFGAFIITTIACTYMWQTKVDFQSLRTGRRPRLVTFLGVTLTVKKAVLVLTAGAIVAAVIAAFLLFSLYKDIRPQLRTILPLG